MKTRGLRETQTSIPEPDLYHQPSYAFDSPLIRCLLPSVCGKYIKQGDLPSAYKVRSKPEKHVAAIHMKNTNSEIIARKALKRISMIFAL